MKLSEGPTALTWSFSLVCLFHKLYGGEILMLNNKIIEHYNPAEISIIEIRILLMYSFQFCRGSHYKIQSKAFESFK